MEIERKDQKDQIQPSLYIEDDPEEGVEYALDVQENQYSTLSEEEHETKAQGGEEDGPKVPLDGEEIDAYCRKFVDFMQVELHKIYDLRSRKISQTQGQVEEPTKHTTPKLNDMGKWPVNSNSMTKGENSHPTPPKAEFENKGQQPKQSKLMHRESKEIVDQVQSEKNPSTFSLKKEL